MHALRRVVEMGVPACDPMSRKKRRSPRTPAKSVRPAGPVAEQRPAASNPSARSAVEWLFPLLLFLVGVAVYWPALSGPFIFDDLDMADRRSIAREADFPDWLRSGRPLLSATFWLSYRLAGGFSPTIWYHLPNVLLHALNAVLLWLFWRRIGALESLRPEISAALRKWLIYGTPLLFLTLPIQAEAVAYISSRSDVLSTTFYLSALCFFAGPLRLRRRGLTALAMLLLTALAASTKQDKVTLPAAVLLLDYLLLSGRDWKAVARSLPTYASLAIAGAAAFFALVKPFLFAESAGFRLDWTTYLFTQFRMYFLYLQLVFAPFGRLNFDHDIAPSSGIFEHGAWLAMAVLAAAAAAAVRWRRKFPLLSFAALFFFLTAAPAGSFFPLLDFAAERRMYLPLAGLLPAVFFLLDRYLKIGPKTAATALIALGAVYSAAALQRAALWGDSLALWQDTAKKSPRKVRPLMWLGKMQYERGLEEEAQRSWSRAAELAEPGSREHTALLLNLGLSYANRKDYSRAVDSYRAALRAEPENAIAWAQLAVARMRLGQSGQGWRDFEKAFEHGGRLVEVIQLRGQEYFLAGRCEEAASDFLQASMQIPESESLRRSLEAARQCAAQAQEER